MAWSLVQQSAAQTSNGTNTLPAGSTAGNLLIIAVGSGVNTAITPPANWLTATSIPNGTVSEAYIFYYPDNPGGLSSFAVTGGGASNWMSVAEFTCWNVSAVTGPSDTGTGIAGAVAAVTAATAGTAKAGDLAIFSALEHFNSATAISWTTGGGSDPPGFTEFAGLTVTAQSNHGYAAYELSAAPASGIVSVTVTSNTASTNAHAWTGVAATFSEPTATGPPPRVIGQGAAWQRLFRPYVQVSAGTVPAAAAAPPGPAGSVPPLIAVFQRARTQIHRALTGAGQAGGRAAPGVYGTPVTGGQVRRRATARAVIASVTGRAFPNGQPQPRATQYRASVIGRRGPARAVIASLVAAPILAASATGGFTAQRAAGQRHRAVTAHITSQAFYNGAPAGGIAVRRAARQVSRAVTGSRGLCGAGFAGRAFYNGQQPGGPVTRRRPFRAVLGSSLLNAGGEAGPASPNGSQPGGVVRRRAPARAVTAHAAGVARYNGSPPGGAVAQRPAARHPRAVTASITSRAYWNGAAPGGLVRRRAAARAVTAGITSRAFYNGQRPGGTSVYRRRPATAVTGHIYGTAGSGPPLGPAGSVQPRATVPLPRRYPARSGMWRAVTGQVPPAPAKRQPPYVPPRRYPARVTWRSLAGPQPPLSGTLQPHPAVARRAAARAVTASVTGRAFPNGSVQPRATVPVPRRYPARAGTWRSVTGPPVNQPGRLQPRAALPPPRRYPARGTWHAAAGQVTSVQRATQPRATVPVPRRYPSRAWTWQGVSAPPPPPPVIRPHVIAFAPYGPDAALTAIANPLAATVTIAPYGPDAVTVTITFS